MTGGKTLDQVDAIVTGMADGKPVSCEVVLDLEVVPLPGQFGGADDVAIGPSSLADDYAVPTGGPYTVTYAYRGKPYKIERLWGDENGQLVSVRP